MNTISKRLLKTAALATLSMGLALAQQSDQLRASIPFRFAVGDKLLPAGDYTIVSGNGSPVVMIRDSHYRAQAMIMSIPGNEPTGARTSRLVFRVHGEKHYLASTWNATAGSAREFPETRAEREVELAAGPTAYRTLVARK
jgi:hypothetical protein